MNELQQTLKEIGFSEVGRWCKVSRQAVYQWYKAGRLPKTDDLPLTDPERTHYGAIIVTIQRGTTT